MLFYNSIGQVSDICNSCVAECEKLNNDHCRECAGACRQCAEEYRAMASEMVKVTRFANTKLA